MTTIVRVGPVTITTPMDGKIYTLIAPMNGRICTVNGYALLPGSAITIWMPCVYHAHVGRMDSI